MQTIFRVSTRKAIILGEFSAVLQLSHQFLDSFVKFAGRKYNITFTFRWRRCSIHFFFAHFKNKIFRILLCGLKWPWFEFKRTWDKALYLQVKSVALFLGNLLCLWVITFPNFVINCFEWFWLLSAKNWNVTWTYFSIYFLATKCSFCLMPKTWKLEKT